MRTDFILKALMFILLSSIIPIPTTAWAHQPVMDMTPRWKGGYGIQLRYESLTRHRLARDGNVVKNPLRLRTEASTLWTEGVYTFTRAHRLTFKMPWVEKRARLYQDGQPRDLSGSGPGDLILGFQNKSYFNKPHYTGNVGFTPSVRLPTGATSGELAVGRGTVDYNVSLSASIEMFKLYTFVDVFSWFHTKGADGSRPGNVMAFDMDVGLHPYHNMEGNWGIFLMMGLNGRQYGRDRLSTGELNLNSGGRTVEIAPTFVFYRNNLMFRAQYHVPVYQHFNGTQLTESSKFQIGIGFAFKSLKPL